MKKRYNQPEIEVVTHSFILMQENSGVADDPMGKENNMWEESDDPIFETNKKNLWDE
ncbi:MAG: hypothetical protein J5506_02050 [Prevotella sp.]|nr:hypothetical protein [Prevotella sp.]